MNAQFIAFRWFVAASTFVAGLFAATLFAGRSLAQSVEATASLTLDQAIAERKVEVQISGRGVSTGDSMWLLVRRKSPEAMRIEIAPGTLLLSKSGNAQRMAVQKVKFEVTQRVNYRQTAEIVLGDNQWRTYLLEAYCCDYGKPTPRTSDKYTVQLQVDPKATVILGRGHRAAVGPKVIQAALWMDMNGVDGERIRRGFELTQDEIDAAVALLKAPDDAPELDVDLAKLIEKINAAKTQVIGKAEITADRTDLRVPVLRTVIGELRRGDQVTVVAKMPRNLAVLAKIDGVERSGVIPVGDAKILQAPAIGGGGVAAAIETFTKRDEDSVPADTTPPRQY